MDNYNIILNLIKQEINTKAHIISYSDSLSPTGKERVIKELVYQSLIDLFPAIVEKINNHNNIILEDELLNLRVLLPK